MNKLKGKELELKVVEVFKEEFTFVCKDLGICKTVDIEIEHGNSPYVMYAVGEQSVRFFTIVGTRSLNKVRINIDSVENELKSVSKVFFFTKNKSLILESYIRTLIRHELRHLWQYDNHFYDGETTFDTSFLGAYGDKREEIDANQYALQSAKNKLDVEVAKLNKTLQELVRINNKELYMKRIKEYAEIVKSIKKEVRRC